MAKDLNSILDSAKFLMSEEGQRQINFAAKNSTFDENGDNTTYVPASYQGMGKAKQETKINKDKGKNIGLPISLLEDMEKDYADGGMLSGNKIKDIDSALDKYMSSQPQRKESINETRRYEPQPQQQYVPQGNTGVDYTIIKAIVEECIKRNMEEIKKSILSESTLRRVKLGEGNKIQLVDNKGNLYESTLEFKKNILKK